MRKENFFLLLSTVTMLLILQGEAAINSLATPNNQANSSHLALFTLLCET